MDLRVDLVIVHDIQKVQHHDALIKNRAARWPTFIRSMSNSEVK